MHDVILDACCLINLAAAGNANAIVEALQCSVHVCSAVAGEAMYLRVSDPEHPDILIAQPADVRAILQAAGIKVAELDGVETEVFVRLAAALDDGEAMSLAIASTRKWDLASDDRKAIRVATSLGVRTMTTPEILKRWAGKTRAKAIEVSAAIKKIETFARFTPRAGSPQAKWWKRAGNLT